MDEFLKHAKQISAIALAPTEDFLDGLATAMLARCHELGGTSEARDFSQTIVLVPTLPIAAELRQAFVRQAQRPLLLPRFETMQHWACHAVLPDIPEPLSDSERLVLLHEALRQRGWFDENALWDIAGEMAALFDALTASAAGLPEDEAALAEQLEHAYHLRDSKPLAFEARVVHELWRALAAVGRPDKAGVYRLRLQGLAKAAKVLKDATQPLLVLLDAPPEESLLPAERDFLLAYSACQPVHVFYPTPRTARATAVQTTLAAAWPEAVVSVNDRVSAAPIFDRAAALAADIPLNPLAGRLQLVANVGREQEACAAVAQIGAWLNEGLRRIVLIAQDRLTARRVRALLEREGILVTDETGWKLSTSRAAAALDALLETAAGGAYYRDLLDLCKSPYLFSDCNDALRKAAVFTLEEAIRAGSVRAGMVRIRRALQVLEQSAAQASALQLLGRVEVAMHLLNARPTTLPRWLERLHKALEALAALEPLRQDAAGKTLLELLAQRSRELADSRAVFSFSAWRDWLNREFENATFRDASIVSPIVLTALNAVCLRRFEAALLLGGDARQLSPAGGGAFFNQSVRRELGLPTREDADRRLRRDLELLLASVPRVVVTWQATRDGEENHLASVFALLATVSQMAWQDDLHRSPLSSRREAVPTEAVPEQTQRALPQAPAALLPRRISVSGYASLVDCPYRFFARHVLGLGVMDEVSEEMAKSDYGALVHRVLERFHTRYPVLAGLSDEQAVAFLHACVDEVFAPAIEENFLALAWRLRWEKRLPAYIAWQRELEAEGWRWMQAETPVARSLPLANGERVEFYGRVDRIDRTDSDETAVSLLDYKTQATKKIRDRLADDVQLPSYAFLYGNAAQAAYVALDDECIESITAGDTEDELMRAAKMQEQRLGQVFDAMYAGTPLPAHGTERVCQWCEMRGLCRKDYVCAE